MTMLTQTSDYRYTFVATRPRTRPVKLAKATRRPSRCLTWKRLRASLTGPAALTYFENQFYQ